MDKNRKYDTMIFGVFDGLHDGHKFFIDKVNSISKALYIALTPTQIVKDLKGKPSLYSIKERTILLQKQYPNAIVLEGDTVQGEWNSIKKYNPDMIVCGYDQDKLYQALESIKDQYNFNLVKIEENLDGDNLHSRFINKSV